MVGSVPVGDGAPVSIQSMLNTRTTDVEACLAQIRALAAAGCEIARLAVPDMEAAETFGAICAASPLPLVADIHFDYRLAIRAAENGAAKIRINPGNIGGEERVRAVVEACGARNIPIRIGVNGGSLEPRLLEKYGHPTPEALVESAFGHIALLEKYGFHDICVSMKSSSVPLMIEAYRLFSERSDYPLHVGVTETGTERMGTIKSVHPAVFIVEVDERRGRKSRQSYQYIDVLTGQVELFDPESGEHIFTPLGNQLEEH